MDEALPYPIPPLPPPSLAVEAHDDDGGGYGKPPSGSSCPRQEVFDPLLATTVRIEYEDGNENVEHDPSDPRSLECDEPWRGCGAWVEATEGVW